MYKYHTPAEYDAIIRETEREMDRRAQQQFEADRLEKVKEWMSNPANAKTLAEVRAEFNRIAGAPAQTSPAAQTAPVSAPAAPQRPPTRAELEAARPWLRPAKPSTKLTDPYVGRRIS